MRRVALPDDSAQQFWLASLEAGVVEVLPFEMSEPVFVKIVHACLPRKRFEDSLFEVPGGYLSHEAVRVLDDEHSAILAPVDQAMVQRVAQDVCKLEDEPWGPLLLMSLHFF